MINVYGEENDILRQYIIFVRNYDPYHEENKIMSILKHDEPKGYYLTYSRNKFEITTSNGLYYTPVFISNRDYNVLMTSGIATFIREKKLERILK